VSLEKKFKVPHTFVILLGLILIVGLLTYVVPAGSYERYYDEATGRNLVDPTTFTEVEKNPMGVVDFFAAGVDGFVEAGYVIALTFAVGGGFFILEKAGIITGAIAMLARKIKNRGILIIPILMIAFAVCDCFVGMCELTMVYVPIILPLMLAMGFDSMTAVATALIGSQIGFTLALANPFTTIIGQKVAGLPIMSGWEYRLVMMVVFLALGITYICRYAAKVKANPLSSTMYEIDLKTRESMDDSALATATLNGRQKAAGVVAILIFAYMVYGVITMGWDMPQIGASFLAIGILGGVIAGMKSDDICEAFIEGSVSVLEGALIIGLSRGIAVVMDNAMITDTIINAMAQVLQGVPAVLSALGMVVAQTIIEFFISSGSGQAVATMPIMAPLADLLGITRQTAVMACQFGDGLTNILYPVSGYFMATLGLAKVPYEKWVKWFIPLLAMEWVLVAIFMTIAQLIQWGPF